MEKTEKLRLLEKLWYSRNPCHDRDAMGNDRFWETVMCVFEDYNKALTIPIVTNSSEQKVEDMQDEINRLKEFTGLDHL